MLSKAIALVVVVAASSAAAQTYRPAPPPANAPPKPVNVPRAAGGTLAGYAVGVAVDQVVKQTKEQYRCRNNVTYPQGTKGTVAGSTPAVMVCNNPR